MSSKNSTFNTSYKIEIFNYCPKFIFPSTPIYIKLNSPLFLEELKEIELTGKIKGYYNVPYTTNKFNKDHDLDLFKVTILYNKLISLGFNCKIIEVSYRSRYGYSI